MLCEFLNRRKLKRTRKRLHSLAFCYNKKVQSDSLLISTQSSDIFERKTNLSKCDFQITIPSSNEACLNNDEVKSVENKNNIYRSLTEKQHGLLTAILSNNEGNCFKSFVRYKTVVCPLSHVVSRLIYSLDSNNLFLLDTVIRTSTCVNYTSPSYTVPTFKSQSIALKTDDDGHCVLLPESTLSQLKKKPSSNVCPGIRIAAPNRVFKGATCPVDTAPCKTSLGIDCLLIFHATEQLAHNDGGYSLEIDYPSVCNYHPVAHSSALDGRSMLYFDPVLGACKAWRWPDLRDGEWLRRLPFCQCKSLGLQRQICINPYHWNRVITSASLKVNSATCKLTHPTELWTQDPDLVSVGLKVSEENDASDVRGDDPTPANQSIPRSPLGEVGKQTIHKDTALSSTAEDSVSKVSRNRTLLWTQYSCPTGVEPSLSSASTESTFLRDDVSKSLRLSSYSYSSSLSSNHDESSSEGLKAKKPRSCPSAAVCDLRGREVAVNRSWANLSYWEAHRHVGVSWYKLTCRTIRICYEDETKTSRTGRVQSGGQHITRSICLSRLLDSTEVHRSAGRHALVCTKTSYPRCIGTPPTDKRSAAGQDETNTPAPLSRLLSVQTLSRTSDRHKSLCSWRLCSRLGRQGISLTSTPLGQVWLDNQCLQSNMPVFVSSPCLSCEDSREMPDRDRPVFRVPAGFSLLVFDRAVYRAELDMSRAGSSSPGSTTRPVPATTPSPCQPPCPVVHISLGKGWGPRYRRPDITHCPARLELWIDNLDCWFMHLPSRAKMPV